MCVSGPVQYSVAMGSVLELLAAFSCEGVREVGSWVLVYRDQRMPNGTGCKMKMKVFDLRRCAIFSLARQVRTLCSVRHRNL